MQASGANREKSPLHQAPAGVKLVVAFCMILAAALLPRRAHWAYAVLAAILVVGWLTSRLPLLTGLRRLLMAEFFVLGIGMLSLLSPSSFPVFVAALIKSNICVVTVMLLAWTTPFHEVVARFRQIGLPGVMITTIALSQRYLPLIVEESRRMQRARASRAYTARRIGFKWTDLASVAGQLFIRCADRAERVYLAMCARGWR